VSDNQDRVHPDQVNTTMQGEGGRRLVLTISVVLILVHFMGLLLAAVFGIFFLLSKPGVAEALVQTTEFDRWIGDGQGVSLRAVFVDEAPLQLVQGETDPFEDSENVLSAVEVMPIESAYASMVEPMQPYLTSGVFYNPAGCLRPEDGADVEGNGWSLSQRTYGMLAHAVDLFDAVLDPGTLTIVYANGVNNGIIRLPIRVEDGALVIQMISGNGFDTRYQEVDPLIRSLRVAGFAAWFWDWDEQYLGSEPVIHAIPIGDESLPDDLISAIENNIGYFNGYYLQADGQPVLDPHGGPIVCQWMIDDDLVGADQVANLPRIGTPLGDWQTLLQQVASGFITETRKETNRLAREIGFLGGTVEDPSNMCGPLTAAILGEAGLLPSSVGPIRDPKSFWLANPAVNGRPWSLFPLDDYVLYNFETSLSVFSFTDWPLCTGDILFTYAGIGEYSHVFVVTEIDDAGRAYSVTNQIQPDGSFLVERVLLYDPNDLDAGAFRNEWTNEPARGRTGLGGFDVLRRISSCLVEGSVIEYTVRPGDTLPVIAATFRSSVSAILTANNLAQETTMLEAGTSVRVPVNLDGMTP